MPRMSTFRLAAHEFTREHGSVLTELFMTKAVIKVEVASLDELETKATDFGLLHAPCNVWITCSSSPKMRGFDKWNDSATKFLFDEDDAENERQFNAGFNAAHAESEIADMQEYEGRIARMAAAL